MIEHVELIPITAVGTALVVIAILRLRKRRWPQSMISELMLATAGSLIISGTVYAYIENAWNDPYIYLSVSLPAASFLCIMSYAVHIIQKGDDE